MIANPPYGIRIGEDEELAEAYPLMGIVALRISSQGGALIS